MLIRRAGYVWQDNRASGGQFLEANVKTCAHCATQIILNPQRQRERGFCRKCNEYICDNPACHVECNPYEKQVDQLYEQAVRGPMIRNI